MGGWRRSIVRHVICKFTVVYSPVVYRSESSFSALRGRQVRVRAPLVSCFVGGSPPRASEGRGFAACRGACCARAVAKWGGGGATLGRGPGVPGRGTALEERSSAMVTAAAAGTAACSRARMRSAPVRSVRTRSGAAGGRRRCAHACEGPSGGEVEGRGRSNGGDEREGGGKPGPESEPFTRRFLEPRIDDRGLPIADALVSGWMVPSTLAIGTIALRLPLPMWLTPALGVPALKSLSYLPAIVSHGAQLAICWTAGALACKVRAKPLLRACTRTHPRAHGLAIPRWCRDR